MSDDVKQRIKEECPIFDYEKPVFPDDCIFNISPSQIDKFFSYPSVWYQENLLGQEQSFQGNTASVTGTIAHYIYKCVTQKIPVTREDINTQLMRYAQIVQNPDLDVNQVMIDYPLVTAEVVNNYVIPQDTKGMQVRCEDLIIAEVLKGIYVGGSCDRLEGDTVVDYKNIGKLPNQDVIPFNYKIQLLAYAYIYRKKGFEVNNIRLVYGVKPTKTIPARCICVNEPIDYVADKLIGDTLQLIAESVLMVKENPRLAYLIFKSMDFKE